MSEDIDKTEEIEHIAAEHVDVPEAHPGDVLEHVGELIQGAAPLIWIQGQNCTGCSVTLFGSDHYRPADLFFGKFSLRYHPTLMSSGGAQAIDQIERTESGEPGKYLVVLEGSIPTGDGEEFCTFGLTEKTKHLMGRDVPADRTAFDWLLELIPGAEAVLAVGNCSAFGGLPTLESRITGATSATDVVEAIDGGKPVINVAGCPPHPDWIFGTLIDLLLWLDGHKDRPALDDRLCLEKFYEGKIHDFCERRKAFEEKRFLTDWNDVGEDEDRCLLKLGCRGPTTRGDCPTRLWNFGTNWCVGANAPCQGCTNPDFYNKLPHPK